MSFETIRHGHKEGESLSAKGVEQAREKAHAMLEEIEEAPDGTVTYVMTSNVDRAIATRDVIEAELTLSVQDREDIEVISIQDRDRIAQVGGDMSRKYVITELQPTTALGFNEKTPSLPAFLKYKKEYQNNEDLIGMTWAARADELPHLQEKVKEQLPGYDVESIKPQEFVETPEEAALKYVRLMKRMKEITEKHFPDHSWKTMHVGHNISSDFAAASLMGKDISVKTVEEMGGKFRDFVESATFEERDGRLTANFRGEEVVREVSLDDVIDDLEKKVDERKRGWQESE